MPKFLICSDLHIHPLKKSMDRLQDCLNVLDWIFTTAEEKNIRNIIVCGDLFHDRQKMDIPTYQRTFEIFRKHLEGTNRSIYLLLGNHDLWHLEKWDISSVFPLASIPNVRVIDYPSTVEVEGFPISFLPFTVNPIGELMKISNTHSPRVLFAHLAIDGAVLNVMHGVRSEVSIEHDGGMTKVDPSIFQNWDFIFLGHYHASQKLSSNIEYVGSPLQLSFGESFQHKHIIVFDTETLQKEYIRNTFSPQHFIISKKDLDKYELKNNFIKVVVEEDMPASDIIELRNNLVKESIGSFEIIHESKAKEHMQVIEDIKSVLLDQGKMMEEYVKQCRKDGAISDSLTDSMLFDIWKRIAEKSSEKNEL